MPKPTSESHSLEARQRRGARIALKVVGIAIVVSLIMAAIVMHTWTMFWIALGIGVPYILLLSAPYWLARLFGHRPQSQMHGRNR